MNIPKQKGGWVIVVTIVVALMLTMMPLPDYAINWRPAWVAMVIFYWCMALPHRVNIGIAWSLGIILDVMQGTLFGQNAIGLALITYIIYKTHLRIRMFPLFQQAMVICLLLLLQLLFGLWVRGIMGVPPQSWTYWMPAITSMLLWPWLFIILRDLRRRYHVS